jgi:hypothetical protein
MQPLVQRQEEEEELQMQPLVQRQEEEEELLQASATRQAGTRRQDGSFEASTGLEHNLAAEKGHGHPLPSEIRGHMESRFGADFGRVRVHTDGRATQLNRSLGSRAFTHGQDIYFRSGHYEPGTTPGQKLLAHELTHTLQQGAVKRIQGWWPTGHRLVTEAAFQDEGLKAAYSEEARKFLIDRSPDMDFIQDQTLTMDDGIKLSGDRIGRYENLIAQGDETSKEQAQEMWDNNMLHYRAPSYMFSHGEGGLYKEDAPSDINEAMTAKMVNESAGQWGWGEEEQAKRSKSLVTLSDALHQAADRGSHGEGRAFTGHDVRLNVPKWKKKYKRALQPWETFPAHAPQQALTGQWDPDNFSVNKKGGVLGVRFVEGALTKFQAAIERGTRVIPGPGSVPKRFARMKKGMFWQSSSSGPGAKLYWGSKSGEGRRMKGKRNALKAILEDAQLLVSQEEQQRAKEQPQVTDELAGRGGWVKQEGRWVKANRGGERSTRLEEGFEFYKTGAGIMDDFQKAFDQFKIWAKPYRKKGGKKTKERKRLARQYYQDQLAEEGLTDKAKKLRASAINKAYEQLFHVPLPQEEAQEQGDAQEVDFKAQLDKQAAAKFKKYKGFRYRKSERINNSKLYYNQVTAQYDGVQKGWAQQVIKATYKRIFNTDLNVN